MTQSNMPFTVAWSMLFLTRRYTFLESLAVCVSVCGGFLDIYADETRPKAVSADESKHDIIMGDVVVYR